MAPLEGDCRIGRFIFCGSGAPVCAIAVVLAESAVEGVAGSMEADALDDGLEAFPAASISRFFLVSEDQHINSIVRRHKTVEGYIARITELDYQFT